MRFLYLFVSLTILSILVGVVFANHKTTSAVDPNKIRVVASFYPVYFFASQIGGQYADVSNVTPAGAEPHDYEPTAQDIAHIESSQMLVLVSDAMEQWGKKVRTTLDSNKINIVLSGDGLTSQNIVEDGNIIVDPHVWLSPILASKMVDAIEAGYEKIDPINATSYRANAELLKNKLSTLDSEFIKGLSTCKIKDIVTSHAAFGYLASRYGLNQVPLAGLSPDSEPSPKQLAIIVQYAKQHDVRYVFFEQLVSPKLASTIASEIGAQNISFNPLEGLTAAEISQGNDYFTQMRLNLQNLKIALQCN